MDIIEKFLQRVNAKLSKRLRAVLIDLKQGRLDHLDIKPLQGQPGAFRCRVGTVRILFFKTREGVHVFDIGFRGNVYKK